MTCLVQGEIMLWVKMTTISHINWISNIACNITHMCHLCTLTDFFKTAFEVTYGH